MARNINTEISQKIEGNISTAVENYYKANQVKLSADKEVKKYGADIKSYLDATKSNNYQDDNFIVKITESESLSYDEVGLLEAVKKLPTEYQQRLIDTVQVVNMTALERLISTGELSPSQFTSAEIRKVTKKLYVSPTKKGK